MLSPILLAAAGAAALMLLIGVGVTVHRHRRSAQALREQAEAECDRFTADLEAQRNRMEAILQNMPQGILVAEAPGGRIVTANDRQIEQILRHSPHYSDGVDHYGEWVGWHADGRPIQPDEWPLARAVLRGEISRNLEVQYLFGDNKRGWLSISAAPVLDSQGRIVAGVALFQDVTEQKWMEELLQQREERYRALLSLTATIVWTAAPDGQILADVPEWEAFTGQTPREYKGMGWLDALHPEDRGPTLTYWRKHIREQTPMDWVYRLRRRDGIYRHVAVRGVPLLEEPDHAGRRGQTGEGVREWFGACTDIEDQQRAEQNLIESEKRQRAAVAESERIGRVKDEFLATLSHELRTPLNAILGWSQILQEPDLPPDELKQGLEVIERNTRIQAQLIEDLLDLSRIISGKLRLNTRPLDLPAVIEAAIESVRPAAEARQIELLPALDEGAGAVRGDPARLQQVVWNLLSNAVKFTPHRGQVKIALRRSASNVEIEVGDNGAGIAPEVLPHIFDRFRQGDSSTTRKHGGLGLGLAIVKQLVEVHGGTVTVRSAGQGMGATFTVRLPLLAVQDEVSPQPSADSGGAGAPDLRGMHVLVVDDEPDAREMVRRVLEHGGARVCAAGSADEAIELLVRLKPDILLSDIGMPERDGFDLIRQIRAFSPEGGGAIPAAALTAFARAEDRQRALACGYQTHLAKPIEPAELLVAVARLGGRG
jgi:PAS domain S-box-containing protein